MKEEKEKAQQAESKDSFEDVFRERMTNALTDKSADPTQTIDKMMGWMMQMTMIREMPKMFSVDSQRPPEPKTETLMDKYGEMIMLKNLMSDGSKGDRDIMLEMIRQDKNGKEDPIYSIMREEVKELKTANESQKNTLYEKIDKLQETAQKQRDEQHEKEITALRDQIDTIASDKYNAPPPPPVEVKRTLDDDMTDMFKQAFKRDFQQTLERKFGVDFNKPKNEQSPTAIDTIERVFKGIAETATEVAKGIGQAQSLSKQNQMTGEFKPLSKPAPAPAVPAHIEAQPQPDHTVTEPPAPVQQPQPVDAPTPEIELPPGDNIYESADGHLLTPEQAQEAIAKGARITEVKEE